MTTSSLTNDQIKFYSANGYLGIDSVITPQEITELRRVTDEFIEKSRQVTESDDCFDLEPGHTPDAPRLRRIKLAANQHPAYNALLHSKPILDIVAQLIGNGIRTNGHKLNMKSAEFGSPVEWHQDFAFYPHTNDDLLAVGIPFDDMTEENGCLLVLPESHKGPILSHHQDGFFVGAVTESDFSTTDAVPLEIPAGGISIHHARTLHGSAPNTSGQQRRLLLIQYCAIDAWPLLDFSGWDSFNAEIVRGEPTFTPRLTEIPARVSLPRPEKQGSIYDYQSILKKSSFDDSRT